MLFAQIKKYRKIGFGFGASLLKHSLYPIQFLKSVLPERGVILDLGCGEGMLTNLLSVHLPGACFEGIDLDNKKIKQAQEVSSKNVNFKTEDIFSASYEGASAVIFNDVLHHRNLDNQKKMLQRALQFLDDEGVIILKEVDQEDFLDVRATQFWDNKLYPDDQLHFRSQSSWVELMSELDCDLIKGKKIVHPWIASRTMLVFKKRKTNLLYTSKVNLSGKAINILLTGSTGFIGNHMTHYLLSKGLDGCQVNLSLLVRNPNKLSRSIREHERVKIIKADLQGADLNKKLEDQYDCVYHLASRVDFFGGKRVFYENTASTQNLVRSLDSKKIGRFIYASTMGAIDRSRWDKCKEYLHEESPAFPVSWYGKSKLEDEKLLIGSKLNYTIMRIPWCYGLGMSSTHHVRVLLSKALKRSFVCKFNFPGRVSLISVENLVEIFCKVVFQKSSERKIYFLSDGQPICFGELFHEMGKMIGCNLGNISLPKLFLKIFYIFRGIFPFQLRCLLTDSLVVSNQKLNSLGINCTPRQEFFLRSLLKSIIAEEKPSTHRVSALITGAAGGIGYSIAKHLFVRGYSLILIDKDEDRLNKVKKEFCSQALVADLSNEQGIQKVISLIASESSHIGLVINNAGIGKKNMILENSKEDLSFMISVNCLAPALIAHESLKSFILNNNVGALINIVSNTAFQPIPFMACYGATKAFLGHFSEAIAGEISFKGKNHMEILTIYPSGTATGFQSSSGVKINPNERLAHPDEVADKIVNLLGKGSRSFFVDSRAKVMYLASKLLPKKIQVRLWSRMMASFK